MAHPDRRGAAGMTQRQAIAVTALAVLAVLLGTILRGWIT